MPFTKWCGLSLVLINNYFRLSWQVGSKKMMIMYMQGILDKMDALQNGYGFFVLVSRTCFHLIKCLCEIDHFVGYSPSNSSHFISLVFCSELAANCLIWLLQHKNQGFFAWHLLWILMYMLLLHIVSFTYYLISFIS